MRGLATPGRGPGGAEKGRSQRCGDQSSLRGGPGARNDRQRREGKLDTGGKLREHTSEGEEGGTGGGDGPGTDRAGVTSVGGELRGEGSSVGALHRHPLT